MSTSADLEGIARERGRTVRMRDGHLGDTATTSAAEMMFLAEHGGVPVEVITSPQLRRAALLEREQATQADWVQVLKTALTTADVAERFGWSVSKVSRLARSRDLFVIKGVAPRRRSLFPSWQFTEDGVVPGLRHVLPHLPLDWHPADVEQWMTTGNDNLAHDASPVTWLVEGDAPEVVAAALSADLVAW